MCHAAGPSFYDVEDTFGLQNLHLELSTPERRYMIGLTGAISIYCSCYLMQYSSTDAIKTNKVI